MNPTHYEPISVTWAINIVMPTDNLIGYSDNYSEICGSLLQYYRDESSFIANGAIADFLADNNNCFVQI